MGFDHRRTGFNLNQVRSPRGTLSYNGVFSRDPRSSASTTHAFADFLLGYPNDASIGNQVPDAQLG